MLSRWDTGAIRTSSYLTSSCNGERGQADRDQGPTFISAKAVGLCGLRGELKGLADSPCLPHPTLDLGVGGGPYKGKLHTHGVQGAASPGEQRGQSPVWTGFPWVISTCGGESSGGCRLKGQVSPPAEGGARGGL